MVYALVLYGLSLLLVVIIGWGAVFLPRIAVHLSIDELIIDLGVTVAAAAPIFRKDAERAPFTQDTNLNLITPIHS